MIRELPDDALAALQDFYRDRDSREKRFHDLVLEVEQGNASSRLSMDMFSEDWNASQFWVLKKQIIIRDMLR